MIHLFNGCGSLCKACNSACGGVCKFCGAALTPCTKVFERPLGGYVVMTAVLTLLAAMIACIGASNKEVRACDLHPLTLYCLLNVLFGLGHTAFAFYLQGKLDSSLRDQSPGEAEDGAAAAAPGAASGQPATSAELLSRASHILLYDIGFCFYVFIFFASFIINCAGVGWSLDCVGAKEPWASGFLMVFFHVLAVCFAILWSAVLWCDHRCGRLMGKQQPSSGGHQGSGLARVIIGRAVEARLVGGFQG
eukprot:CAMPEP_0204574756 /NCGR_PEP_ID=MMETSP0661-20131031/40789_1 /ASSEMBLY_ACC=CAM_ASM_000606 /TAXON_ID=109239 /ORGANISM="Alexandrium margalefi, Strain AMGDE01CS-322" /LENGTH=248 /DNA_ID=CAMNT_0051583315 /DNA_START=69 /DNA_END=811 /DNA_ORIENTATION=+